MTMDTVKVDMLPKGGLTMEIRLTPVKAIRAKCLDCMGGSSKEVKRCNIPDCSLFPYRLGKRPKQEKRIENG
jgi:hypothetical protein